MYKLCLLLIFNLNCLVKSYVNVAFNRPAWQQNPFVNRLWGAERAVDGLYSNLTSIGRQCVISANHKSTAEWRVDLDLQNDYTTRFLGFSMYISNTTHKEDGILCFKDINYTRATIPNPTNVACITHGRYVIYYNNRTYYSYPDGYSRYAFNELCEVEVYGCPTPGFYGEDCYQHCPQNCQEGHCHIVDGTCLGCVAGYTGSNCNEQCSNKTYGLECQQTCGHCTNSEPCHHMHGRCPNGCDRGWYGYKCDRICPEDRYSYNCHEQCNVNCGVPYRCDRVTGNCKGGCQRDWKGVKCDTKCITGKFGRYCNTSCGHCLGEEQCHYTHGTCPNGCDSGYRGSDCKQACNNNTYGYRCSLKCGNCLYRYGEQCHHVTGQCPRGCDVGYQGGRCDQDSTDTVSNCQSSIPLYVCVSIIILFGSLIVFLVTRQLGISVCKAKRSHEMAIKNLNKLRKDSEYMEPSLVFVCDQENTTAHAYQELGEISPYFQNDELP